MRRRIIAAFVSQNRIVTLAAASFGMNSARKVPSILNFAREQASCFARLISTVNPPEHELWTVHFS